MRKFMALAAGAALLGGTIISTRQAEARPGYRGYHGGYGGYRHYGHRRGYGGAGIAAGVAGALIGGAIAAQQPRYYGYGPGYGYGYGYAPRYRYRAYGPPAYYYGY